MVVIGILFLVIGFVGVFGESEEIEQMLISILFLLLGTIFLLVSIIKNPDYKTKKREYIKYKIEEYKDSINQIQYQKSLEQEMYTLKDSLQQLKNK